MIDQETLRRIDEAFEAKIEEERTGIENRIARLKAGRIELQDLPHIHDKGGLESFVSHLRSGDNGVRITAIMWQNLIKDFSHMAVCSSQPNDNAEKAHKEIAVRKAYRELEKLQTEGALSELGVDQLHTAMDLLRGVLTAPKDAELSCSGVDLILERIKSLEAWRAKLERPSNPSLPAYFTQGKVPAVSQPELPVTTCACGRRSTHYNIVGGRCSICIQNAPHDTP